MIKTKVKVKIVFEIEANKKETVKSIDNEINKDIDIYIKDIKKTLGKIKIID